MKGINTMFKIDIDVYTSKDEIGKIDPRLISYNSIREIKKITYHYNSTSKRYVYTDSDHFLIKLDELEYLSEVLVGTDIKSELKELHEIVVRYEFIKKETM